MTWRSGNPALQPQTFTRADTSFGADRMTVTGTVNKTALSLLILLACGCWAWSRGLESPVLGGLMMAGVIGGLILAIVTVFKQAWAPYTTPLYAACEGLALGGISLVFNRQYPGIASQAVLLTVATLGVLLVGYRAGLIQVSSRFRLGVVAATGGIALVYFASFILGMFGVAVPLVNSNGTFGILFSVFVVAIAALNLVLDFDFIDQAARRGAPKYMEWYGAFGLLVTLVWLYLEMLRLLAKLQSRER